MNKETEKIVDIKDIKLEISNRCYETYPCMHDVILTINNVLEKYRLDGDELYLLTKYINNKKHEHFRDYDLDDDSIEYISDYVKNVKRMDF
jgi:hypothetical protein